MRSVGWKQVLFAGAVTLAACSSSTSTSTATSGNSGAGTVGDSTIASTAPSSTASTTTQPAASTTTTEPLTLVGAVVRVANCSGRPAAATHLSDALAEKGFTMAPSTNGFGPDARLDHTKVYALLGSEQVAMSVSRVLGGVKVLPMPVPAWIDGGTAALGDTKVLVMLGRDLGNKPLPPTAPVSG